MSTETKSLSGRQAILSDLRAVLEQTLQPGARLPSVRALMQRYGASPVTVSAVIAQLVREGLVITQPGRGTFVAERTAPSTARDLAWQTLALSGSFALPGEVQALFQPPAPGVIPLGSGYADEALYPLDLLGQASAKAARRPGAWSRLAPEGLEPLRAWFAQELGHDHRAEDVLISPGGQAALSTTLRALLSPGAPLLVESPTYYGVLAAARAVGARAVPVPADAQGVRPDLLERAFQHLGARVLYLQPLYANPSGAVLATARRAAVLEAAERAGAFIIEDDYARDLTLEGTPPPPLATLNPERVIYLRSLTKSAAPGLRVAGVAALGPVRLRLRNARALEEFFVSGPLQEIALQLLTARNWPRHLLGLRASLRERRDALLAALARDFPALTPVSRPVGGSGLWARLPDRIDDGRFVTEAARKGVQLIAGRSFFPAEADGSFVRLSYAACSPRLITEGIARLKSISLDGT